MGELIPYEGDIPPGDLPGICREEGAQASRRVGPWRFYPDGTCEYRGTCRRRPRARVTDVVLTDTRMNKPPVGRAAGAALTGGLSLLLTSGRTGSIRVTVVTDQWALSTGGGYRLYEAALVAKAQGER